MNKINCIISGVGGYVPEYKLTNKVLETMVDTTEEWITTRTGILERRILQGKEQGTSELGVRAIENLVQKTGLNLAEVDLLICATVTPDFTFPSTANIICDKLGIRNILSFDINAACSGFLYALVTASQFIETGKYKKVIVVGADKMSSIIDYSDRSTCVIFGDGGGAVLLEPSYEVDLGIRDSILQSDGVGCAYLHKKSGGSVTQSNPRNVLDSSHYVYQEGQAVFKFAVNNMSQASVDIMERNNLSKDDVHWFVPHQANKRIIDACAQKMGIEDHKIMLNIHKYGNTTAATIPLCLWDYESQIKKGDNLIFAAFGGGFTWGSVYVKWAY
jgi:3-oxoacyl-[acyl-carrier-protein] synthase-3